MSSTSLYELLHAGRGVGGHGILLRLAGRDASGLDGFAVAGLGGGGAGDRRGLVVADELVQEGADEAADDRADDVDAAAAPLGVGAADQAWPRMSGPISRAGLSAAPVIGPTRMMIAVDDEADDDPGEPAGRAPVDRRAEDGEDEDRGPDGLGGEADGEPGVRRCTETAPRPSVWPGRCRSG